MPPSATGLSERQALSAAGLGATSLVLLLWVAIVLVFAKDTRLMGCLLAAQGVPQCILWAPFLDDFCEAREIGNSSVVFMRVSVLTTAFWSLSLILLNEYTNVWWLTISLLSLVCACASLTIGVWPQLTPTIPDRRDYMTHEERLERQRLLIANNAENNEDETQSNNIVAAESNDPNADTADADDNHEVENNNDANQEEENENSSSNHDYQLLVDDDDDDEENSHENSNATTDSSTDRLRGTRRLLQLARPQVRYLYLGCAVLLIRLPFSLAMPHFVSTTLGALSSTAPMDFAAARRAIFHLLVCGTIDALLDFWCVFLFGYANQRIVRGVRLDLFRRLLGQEVAFFDQTNSGTLASRLNSDCSEMAGDLTWFFRFSIESVVRIVGIAAYMMIRSPELAACALAIVPVVAAINKVYGDWLRRNAVAVQDALAQANRTAQESLANIRTVVAFGAEQRTFDVYRRRIQHQYQLNIQQLCMTGIYYMAVSTFLINTVVQGTLLWVGSVLVAKEKLSPQVLLAFMLYQGGLQNETLNLFQSYSSLIKSSGAGDKVFGLLDRKPPAPATGSAAMVHSTTTDSSSPSTTARQRRRQRDRQYEIEFKDVTFRYPSRPDHLVLDKLNLTIRPGETVALVGQSGCGKSSLVGLLQRFYDPTYGQIRINGRDLRNINLEDHRRHIGVVTQNPVLFDDTIWRNIVYGCFPEGTREQAVRAARLANAHTFIREFPDGYDTPVGEGGIQLSGGQIQRIAIARAIVQKPALLLLDEATSALDTESEIVVQQALDQLLSTSSSSSSHAAAAGMTTVVVAHRLQTIRNADKIVVIQDGGVAECGTHDELMTNDGIYRRMVRRGTSPDAAE